MLRKQNLKSTQPTKILTLSNINFINFQDVTERFKDGPIPFNEENTINTGTHIFDEGCFMIKGREEDRGLYKIFRHLTNEVIDEYHIIVSTKTMYERQSEYIKSMLIELANGIYYVVLNKDLEVINYRVEVKEVDKNGTFELKISPPDA